MVRRAAVAAGAVALLVPAGLVVAGSGAAWAGPGNCTGTTTVTCTYTSAGTSTFTVPAGVASLDVTAVGAAGGRSCQTSFAGGSGASVEDTAVPVSGGEVLTVIVGGAGGNGTATAGGAGGTPGGGGPGGNAAPETAATCAAGGGGGFSGLVNKASGNPQVIAAAGGGDAGEPIGTDGAGGGTGDTGTGGGPGDTACLLLSNFGCGGGGGTSTMGGAGGSGGPGGINGSTGASLSGGRGGNDDLSADTQPESGGGGGGGGYYGGGGGGSAGDKGQGNVPWGGGGGGGSSFGISGLVHEKLATTAASVTISYAAPPPDLSLGDSAPAAAVIGHPYKYTLTATNTGGLAATGVTVTDTLPASTHFISAASTQGSCTRTHRWARRTNGGTVSCTVGTLAGGASVTLTITVTPTKPGKARDAATVSAGNVTADSDDAASAPVTVHVLRRHPWWWPILLAGWQSG